MAKEINNLIYDIIDSNSGEYVTFTKVTTYYDGTSMTDEKCDSVIYRKKGSDYYRLNFPGYANVKWFGAVGDGVTDDTLSIQQALNCGEKTIFFENNKTYLVNSGITIPSEITILGNNATLKPGVSFPVTNIAVIGTADSEILSRTSLSISISKGIREFSYSGASALTVGNFIIVGGPSYVADGANGNGYNYGWYGVIDGISGNTVTMNVAATDSFTGNSIKQYKSHKNVHVDRLRINMSGRTTGFGLSLNQCLNSSVVSCDIQSDGTPTSPYVGLMVLGVNVDVRNNIVKGFRMVTDGAAYCIAVAGHNINVEKNEVSTAKHCITSAVRTFISTNINYYHNNIIGGKLGAIDYHANVRSGICKGNNIYVKEGVTGIAVRCGGITLDNNIIYADNRSSAEIKAIYLSEVFDGNCIITNNKIYINSTGGTNHALDINSSAVTNNVIISNNYFTGDVEFYSEVGTGLKVINNYFEGSSTVNAPLNLNTQMRDYIIEGNTFVNNYVSGFNFSISCGAYFVNGLINNNIFKVNNNITNTQIRLNGSGVTISNNTFISTASTNYISDLSSGRINYITGNKRKNNTTNGYFDQTYSSLPSPIDFFEGRTVVVTSGTSATTLYTCYKTNNSTFEWRNEPMRKHGSSTQSGNGVLTSFNITHGLGSAPSLYDVKPISLDATNILYFSANTSALTVFYAAAPTSGTSNLSYIWWAEK